MQHPPTLQKGEASESFNVKHIFPEVPFVPHQPVLLGSNMPQGDTALTPIVSPTLWPSLLELSH